MCMVASRGCPRCQQLGRSTRRDMMPLNPLIVVDIFCVWGTDFIGPIPIFFLGMSTFFWLLITCISRLRLYLLGPMRLECSEVFEREYIF